MNDCCKGKQTAYCSSCGANLKGHTLIGLLEYVQNRLLKAKGLLNETCDDHKRLAPREDSVKQWTCWRDELDALMKASSKSPAPSMGAIG